MSPKQDKNKCPITCHVLDTSIGKPAANISVNLKQTNANNESKIIGFSKTDSDGRVNSWFSQENKDLLSFNIYSAEEYTIEFSLIDYYLSQGRSKEDIFFPKAVVSFTIPPNSDANTHFHIPLLLSPYSYTTYRGS